MKRILMIVFCCVAIIGIIFLIGVNSLKKQYLLQTDIVAFTKEPEPVLCIFNSQTGTTEEVDPEWYAAAQGKDVFRVSTSGEVSEIIRYSPSGTVSLFAKTQKVVRGQPVAVGDEVYVVAESDNEKEDWLYKCNDSELCLVSNIDIGGRYYGQPYPLCAGDDYLLYSARTEDDCVKIIRLDCKTLQETVILSGYDPVWKEAGKSFFYLSEEDALCQFDLELQTSEMICDTVEFRSLQGWNSVDQVLYVKYHPVTLIGDEEIGINDAFYYLHNKQLLDCFYYTMLTGRISSGSGFRFIGFLIK